MKHSKLSILIPAAGASLRLGQAKQLVKYRGQGLIRLAIENAASLAPREIIVVTGAHAAAVEAATQKTSARCVHNPNWADGMGTSIATGMQAISEESSGVMILLCDQWRIQPHDLKQLAEKWYNDTRRIVCAQAQNYRGPPAVFPSSCFTALGRLRGAGGAHSIVDDQPELPGLVTISNAVFDLDTPQQLVALQSG